MNVNRGWLWAAFVAVIALVLVSTLVVDPTARAALSVVAIAPLLFLTARVAKTIEQREAYQKRKFSKLRGETDEFLMAVRNLNRITLVVRDENPPDNAQEMLDEVVGRLHELVDRIVDSAGQADSDLGAGAESGEGN
jgi:hypothetical protein